MQLWVDRFPGLVGGYATNGFVIIVLRKKGGFSMNMADRIQNLRKEKNYSQEELADKIGVSRQAVSKWESEQSKPDLEKIIIMSELFGVTTDYILKGLEPISINNKNIIYSLYLGFAISFATIAGIWSFTANRFRIDECLLIVMAGAVVGLGIGLIVQAVSNLMRK